MKYLKVLPLAFLAGVMIALGGLANVACSAAEITGVGKILGSVFFSLGLLAVCGFGLFLFTGKIGYAFEKKADYFVLLFEGLLGNAAGAFSVGALVNIAIPTDSGKIGSALKAIADAKDIVEGGETWYAAFIMAILCGVLVFVGVDLFKRKPGIVGTVGLILSVAVFVIVGAEHCIANMFYFAAAGHWTWGMLINILFVTFGNALGALLFWLLEKAGGLIAKPSEKEETK